MRPGLLLIVAGAASLFSTGLAQARVHYTAYHGADAVHTGEGGTRVARDGMDIWTSGTPDRRFEILGIMTDRRDRIADGRAIGSPRLVRRAHALRGDALILVDQSEGGGRRVGSASSSSGVTHFGSSRPTTVTTFLLVRYLD
jgi:hypothetical protein